MYNKDPSLLKKDFEINLAEIIFNGELIDAAKIEKINSILSGNCAEVKQNDWFRKFKIQLSNGKETMDEQHENIIQNFISNNRASCTISGGRKSTKGTKRKTKGRKTKKTKRRTGK